VNFNEF